MSYSLSRRGLQVHEIFQARILEWVAFPFSRGYSQPRDWTQVSHIAGEFFISWATREAPRPSRTNTKKRCPFNPRWLECKSRKSRDTWIDRQIWPWSTKKEAGQRITEFCQESTLVIANTLFQQHKRRLYTWTSPGGQYRNKIDYTLCSQRQRSSIQSAKTRLGADCGSDHELLIAKLRLKLKKVGKTTRPFRHDLNHILYDYTLKVTNRFKGLYLIEYL